MKRFISFLLVFCLVLSLIIPAKAEEPIDAVTQAAPKVSSTQVALATGAIDAVTSAAPKAPMGSITISEIEAVTSATPVHPISANPEQVVMEQVLILYHNTFYTVSPSLLNLPPWLALTDTTDMKFSETSKIWMEKTVSGEQMLAEAQAKYLKGEEFGAVRQARAGYETLLKVHDNASALAITYEYGFEMVNPECFKATESLQKYKTSGIGWWKLELDGFWQKYASLPSSLPSSPALPPQASSPQALPPAQPTLPIEAPSGATIAGNTVIGGIAIPIAIDTLASAGIVGLGAGIAVVIIWITDKAGYEYNGKLPLVSDAALPYPHSWSLSEDPSLVPSSNAVLLKRSQYVVNY